MDFEVFSEKFNECVNNASSEEIVALWNNVAENANYLCDYVYRNDEEFMESHKDKIFEMLRNGFCYHGKDDFAYFDGYDNIVTSSDTEDLPIDFSIMKDYYFENHEELEKYSGFEDVWEEDDDDEEIEL